MKKDCKFCDKKGLMILPLRYSVAVADDIGKELGALPTLPGHLGGGVKDLALTYGKYVPAFLRPGYLYVLIDRKGIKSWDAYYVTEGAYLYKFPAETPPVGEKKIEFSCDPAVCGIDASMISIDKAADVEKVYFLFTPSVLTSAKLKEYKAGAESMVAKKKMQVFSPKAWLAGNKEQLHTLSAKAMRKHTLEWILFDQGERAVTSPLGIRMATQLFRPLPDAFSAYFDGEEKSCRQINNRLGALHTSIVQREAAAFVLYDPIGITQELNDFRNAPVEGLQNYLAAIDEFGSSNEHRMQVYEAIEEIRIGFENGIVRNTQEFQEKHQRSSDQFFEYQLATARQLRDMGRIADAENVEKEVREGRVRRGDNYRKALEEAKAEGAAHWQKKYQSRLDTGEMKAFRTNLHQHTQRAFETAEKRASDHMKWFVSDRVVDAFDAYDPNDKHSGYSFALQSAVCSLGMAGCKSNDTKLDEWIKASSIERKNLYMRGFLYNQSELFDAAKTAFADIQSQSVSVSVASAISGKQMISATKSLVDGFKKLDSAFDEWVRNQGNQEFSRTWVLPGKVGAAVGAAAGNGSLQKFGIEIILFHKASEITRAIFRTGLGGAFDKALTASLSGLLYARLGALTEKLAYDELMLKIPPEKLADGYKGRSAERNQELQERHVAPKAAKVAKQVDDSLEGLIADARSKVQAKVKPSLEELAGSKSPPTNNYHQTRIGVLLGCIEMIALGEKISRFQPDSKGWVEVGGSTMALGSIVLDTYYSAAKSIREIEPWKSNNAINKSAEIVRGGFKLGAGVLSFGAGLCGAYLDYLKLKEAKDRSLVTIYFLRAGTGFISAGLTITAGFSYCRPLLEHMAQGFAKHSIRYRKLIAAGELAAGLATRVRLLVWIARLNWIGLALTAIEIGYLYYKDDVLQEWCEKSVFRRDKKYKSFWTGQITTKDSFQGAIQELSELDTAATAVGITP